MSNEMEQVIDQIEAAPPPPPAPATTAPRRGRPAAAAASAAMQGADAVIQREAREETSSVLEQLKNLAGGASVKVKLTRSSPKSFRGRNVSGFLETLDEIPTEEEIAERFGGGTFTVQVQRQTAEGRLQYAGQRQVAVAGEPKLSALRVEGDEDDRPLKVVGDTENVQLSRTAMQMAAEQAAQERKRADRLEEMMTGTRGTDPALMALMREQISAANRRAEQLEARLHEIINKPPDRTSGDRLVEKLLGDDQGRMNQIREAHRAEISAVREQAREDLKREQDRADRNIERLEREHAREIDNLRRAQDGTVKAMEASFGARIIVLEGENKRLERDLGEVRAEERTLRAAKEKPITDQIVEFSKIKEALNVIMPEGEAQEQHWMEKLLDKAAPMIEGVGKRISGAPQPGQQLPPHVVAALQARQQQMMLAAQQAQQAQQQQPQQPPQPPQPQFDQVTVDNAITFIESAIRNEADPVQVASAATSLIPGEIIARIKEVGPDEFIKQNAKLDPSSPIMMQAGRNFVRKFAKALIGAKPEG